MHLISKDGLLINPEQIRNFSFLASKNKETRGFLGLTGYCRNCVPNFSLTAQLLYALFTLDQPDLIEWTPEGEKAISTLKTNLTQAPALVFQDTRTERRDTEAISRK